MNRHTLAKKSTGMLLFALLAATLVISGCGSDATPAKPATPVDEGSLASPVPVTVGTATNPSPYNASIAATNLSGTTGNSYYTFTTGTTAAAHTIALTNTDSHLEWFLYDAAGWAIIAGGGTPVAVCANPSTGPADVLCPTGALLASTTYYLLVGEYEGIAGFFTLNVTTP